MILIKAENFLGNLSFGVLFFNFLLTFFQAAFSPKKVDKNSDTNIYQLFLIFFSNITLASLLLVRWINSNHFPLSNLYESLLFLAWGLSLIVICFYKNKIIGVIFSPAILFIDAFATLSLPSDMQKAAPLVPALKSNWLMMHVSIMMLSYATLIAGSLLAITFLIILRSKAAKMSSLSTTIDNLSYRLLGIGFPLLTLGILSGAIWANEAWGSYWSWDPKETWALITWLIFAIYFHFRIIRGWEGRRPAIIASFGFVIVWVCYLGVNLLGKGLHSYGWF